MTINIANDIDLNIRKLDEMLEKMKLIEDKSKMLNFITIQEFAKIRNCSIKTAQDIFNDSSFPSENYGKQKVVELEALRQWYMKKRNKNESYQTAQKTTIVKKEGFHNETKRK